MINHLALGRWNLDQPTFESHSYTVYSLQETEKKFYSPEPGLVWYNIRWSYESCKGHRYSSMQNSNYKHTDNTIPYRQ